MDDGQADPARMAAAVVLTALAHAGYKTALFVWPPVP